MSAASSSSSILRRGAAVVHEESAGSSRCSGATCPGFTHAGTSRAGEEGDLAEQAIADGFNLIVAVGGDGTWSNVADRIVSSHKEDVALGLLASGTGNDFGRNFSVSIRDPELAVQTLAKGLVRSVDVGRVVSRGTPLRAQAGSPGASSGRHFLNLIGFGFDVAVIEDTADARFLRGELLYKTTALKNLFSYAGVSLELESEGLTVDGEQLMLTISNAPFFRGRLPDRSGGGPERRTLARMRHRQHGCLHPVPSLQRGTQGAARALAPCSDA